MPIFAHFVNGFFYWELGSVVRLIWVFKDKENIVMHKLDIWFITVKSYKTNSPSNNSRYPMNLAYAFIAC